MYTASMRTKLAIIFFVVLISPSIASAKSADTKLEVNISSETQSQVSYRLLLEFSNASSVTNSISIVLPFLPAGQPDVRIDGAIASARAENLNLVIDLSANPIRGNSRKELIITFPTSSAVQQVLQTKVLSFLGVSDDLEHDQFTFQLSYPTNWGEPFTFSDRAVNKQEQGSQTTLQFTDIKRSINFIWQLSKLTGNFKSRYEINSATGGDYLIPIPHNDNVQKILWYALPENSLGLYDQSGNEYIYISLASGERRLINYEFSASIDSFTKVEDLSGFSLNNGLPEYQSKKDFKGTEYSILAEMLDSIVSEFTPVNGKPLPGRDLLSDYSIDSSKASPFDYCLALSSMAKQSGIPSRMMYGSQLLLNNSSSPHLWCEFLINNEVFVADPYLTDVIGSRILHNFRLGKLVLGKLNFASEFIPLIDEQIVLPTAVAIRELPPQGSGVNLAFETIEKVSDSAFLVGVDNFSRNTVQVKELKLDKATVSARTFRDFNYLLLPGQVNNLVFELPNSLATENNEIHTLQLITTDTNLTKDISNREIVSPVKQYSVIAIAAAILIAAIAAIYLGIKRIHAPGSI